ncbi:MAG: HEAT repeat domain-containing protein, partial [bacterium]
VARPASPPAQDVKPEVPLPRESYVLTEQEVEKLRKEMAVEAGWDMGFQLINLICEVLVVREEMDDYPLALDVMERVIGHFVRRGSFGHASRTLKAFRDLEQDSAALPERHRVLLSQAVQRMGDAERIQEIGETLNRGLDSEMAELETYLRLLPRRAVEPLMDLLGEVKHRKGRRVLCEALVDLLGSNLEPLANRLDDPRWFVVRNLIYILRLSGSRNGLKYLRQTLSHPHPKVRQETLRALDAMGMARSPEFLLGLLESRDEICLTWALERLAAVGDRRAAAPLWKLIRARAFRDQSWHDKRAYFEALGRCAPPEMLPAVKALFQKRSWFERPKDLEVRAGAAIALGLIGGEQVISLLNDGCHAEEAVMREACRQALDTVRRVRAGASPEEVSAQAQTDQAQMDKEET